MSYSEQMITQDPIDSARAALRFQHADVDTAAAFALIAIAEELRKINDREDQRERLAQL